MGLTSANAYIESHGGRIQIDSRVDEGTSVTLILPADRRYHSKLSKAG